MTDYAALAGLVPDEPRWIDLRGLLLSGRCTVFGEGTGFVVRSQDHPYGAVYGDPHFDAILEAADSRPKFELLGQEEEVGGLRQALPGWREEGVLIHRYKARVTETAAPPETSGAGAGFRVEIVDGDQARDQAGKVGPGAAGDSWWDFSAAPKALAGEMTTACALGLPVAAALEGRRAVAFCYAPLLTEGLWDVSVDTVEEYRRRGLAAACFHQLRDHLLTRGVTPVWGAMESNLASRRLAAKLGFVLDSRLVALIRN